MAEFEDLRDRPLAWTVDICCKGEIDILQHGRKAGRLSRPSRWKALYHADVAGVGWRIRTAFRRARNTELLGFANGDYGLGEGRRKGQDYEAKVDGEAYRMERDGERALWRNGDGFVVASFAFEPNPRMELRWLQKGTIRVYTACSVSHAPVLVILGLIQIVHNGFLTSSYGGLLIFDGFFGGMNNP